MFLPQHQRATKPLLANFKNLKSAEAALQAIPEDNEDVSLLEQHQVQLTDFKEEVAAFHDDLSALDLEDDNDLITIHSQLEKHQFDCSHNLLGSCATQHSTTLAGDGTSPVITTLKSFSAYSRNTIVLT